MYLSPLISVIVPCYNQGMYLPEALDSVINQTYNQWECIIINDGSTDDTADVAKTFCEKDSRFKYVYKKNGGLSSARNAGIQSASGEYILPLDADDKISGNYLQECLTTIQADVTIKIVYGAGMKFGYVNEQWNLPDYDEQIMLFKNIIHCCGLYKKDDWKRAGGYDTNMQIALEDWDFWLGILQDGGKAVRNPNVTFFYRIRKDSMLNKLSFMDKEKIYQYVYTKHAGMYNKYFINPIRLYKDFEVLKKEHQKLQQKSLYSYYSRLRKKWKKLNLFA